MPLSRAGRENRNHSAQTPDIQVVLALLLGLALSFCHLFADLRARVLPSPTRATDAAPFAYSARTLSTHSC